MIKLKLLAVALDQHALEFVKSCLQNYELDHVSNSEDFMKYYDTWKNDSYDAVICGLGWEDLPAIELSQSLKMTFVQAPIYFVALDSQIQEAEILIKNGFLDCFYYPMDKNFISITLRETERNVTGQSLERLVEVSLAEIQPEDQLDFELSLYLSANNRYIKLNNRGTKLSSRIISNLDRHSTSHVFVKESQLKQYYSFLTSKIKNLMPSPQQKKAAARRLFHDLLSPKNAAFAEGKEYVEYANQVIAEYVKSPDLFNFQKELLKSTGSTDNGLYEKAQKVSTICGLIALATDIVKTEDIVIAALMCDLGMSQMPLEILEKTESEMSAEERDIYHTHVAKSLSILAGKRIVILPKVRDAITQHHERFDGKGFPEKKPGFKICTEAQVLSLAQQLEDLLRIRPRHPRLSPQEAFELVSRNGSINPDILREVKHLFSVSTDETETQKKSG